MKVKSFILLSLLLAETSFAVTPLWIYSSRGDFFAVRSLIDSVLLELIRTEGTDDDFIAYNNALEALDELAANPYGLFQEIFWHGREIDDGNEQADQDHSEVREFAALNVNRRNGPYDPAVVADSVRHASLSAIRHLMLYGFPADTFFERLESQDDTGATLLLQFLRANRHAGVRLMLALGADFAAPNDHRPSIFRLAMLQEDASMRRLFLISLLDRLLHRSRMHRSGFLLTQEDAANMVYVLTLYHQRFEETARNAAEAAAMPAPTVHVAMGRPMNPNAAPFVPGFATSRW